MWISFPSFDVVWFSFRWIVLSRSSIYLEPSNTLKWNYMLMGLVWLYRSCCHCVQVTKCDICLNGFQLPPRRFVLIHTYWRPNQTFWIERDLRSAIMRWWFTLFFNDIFLEKKRYILWIFFSRTFHYHGVVGQSSRTLSGWDSVPLF